MTEQRHLNWYMILQKNKDGLNENKINEIINEIKRYDETLKILNKGSHYTKYGNIAHVLVNELLTNTNPLIYIRFLYILVEVIDCIDLNLRIHFIYKPLHYFHVSYDNSAVYDVDKYKKYHAPYKKIIEYILEKKLLIKQQAYIRRYLAMKKVHRLRLQKCLEIIIYAPAGQIEFCESFTTFKGGIYFLENQYNFNSKKKNLT